MPVYSMTGFASARLPLPDHGSTRAELTLELRSVNSRFLDLAFHLQDELRFCEPLLRRLLDQRLQRGKVEVRAGLRQQAAQEVAAPTPALLEQLANIQAQVRQHLPDAAGFTTAQALQWAEASTPPARQQLEPALLELAGSAVEQLLQARAHEGQRLADMLRTRCDQLSVLAEQAAPLLPAAVAAQKERFLARWQEAMADTAGTPVASDAAQERALAEAASYALRLDVAEELDRLGAHVAEIRSLLDRGGRLGKRLGFLIQELHREANTLGAKAASLPLSRISVDMKVLIEQMREQVQNVE